LCCGITLTNARGQKKEEETKEESNEGKEPAEKDRAECIPQKSQKEFRLEYNNNINYNFSDF